MSKSNALSIVGLRATKPEEVEPTLKKGLNIPGPVVMDFHVEREEGVFPMVKPGTSLIETKLKKEELL